MTVADLIEALRAMPQNKPVEIFVSATALADPDPDVGSPSDCDFYFDSMDVAAKGDVVVLTCK